MSPFLLPDAFHNEMHRYADISCIISLSHTNMYLFAKKDFTLAVTVLYETEAD